MNNRVLMESPDITVYHGSNKIIEKPLFGGGKPNNDYGVGFYTTQYPERAEEWALLMPGASYCNIYTCNTEGLRIVDLDDYGPLVWIAEVLKNRGLGERSGRDLACRDFCRKYCINLKNADIIVGYRADDSYFSIIQSFVDNLLTVEEVVNYFYKVKLGRQIFFKSERSFQSNHLKFVDVYKVSAERQSYALNNDKNARNTILRILHQREYDVLSRKIVLNVHTFSDCLRNNYRYSKERGIYCV